MKKLITVALSFIFTVTAFSQTKPTAGLYGPIAYRTLEQTIGEDYVILPMNFAEKEFGYDALRKAGEPDYLKLKDSTLAGKIVKLVSIDDKKYAHLKDEHGVSYTCDLVGNYYQNIAPIYDFNEAKKKFLQKTLWLNNPYIEVDSSATTKDGVIKGLRFEPVEVVDIQLYDFSDCPIKFIVKTAKGETGYLHVDVSGTNTNREFIFEKYFFEQDPKLIYHFTPQIWDAIKIGLPKIGMTTQQVRMCIGPPNDINRTVTGKSVTEQYVYGYNKFSYYYFTNGKLTTIQL